MLTIEHPTLLISFTSRALTVQMHGSYFLDVVRPLSPIIPSAGGIGDGYCRKASDSLFITFRYKGGAVEERKKSRCKPLYISISMKCRIVVTGLSKIRFTACGYVILHEGG